MFERRRTGPRLQGFETRFTSARDEPFGVVTSRRGPVRVVATRQLVYMTGQKAMISSNPRRPGS
jgi:hypothetical protein